jgi:TonB family protein
MWLGWLLAALVLLVAAARPDDSKNEKSGDAGDEPVYTLGDGVTAPRVIKQVNPQYSTGSRGIRVQGSVLIGTVVTSHGTPKNTHVVRGLDKDIDTAAVDAVNKWLFEPGKKDGKPVAVSVQIELHFHSM